MNRHIKRPKQETSFRGSTKRIEAKVVLQEQALKYARHSKQIHILKREIGFRKWILHEISKPHEPWEGRNTNNVKVSQVEGSQRCL